MKYLRSWPCAALLALAGCASVDEYRAPRVDMPDTAGGLGALQSVGPCVELATGSVASSTHPSGV